MSLRIEKVVSLNGLSSTIRGQWSQLPVPSPMQSSEWLLRWWATLDGDNNNNNNQPCLLLVWDGPELVAVAPWYLRARWPAGGNLRFLGDGLLCSDHATVAVYPDRSEEVLDLICKWLLSEAGHSWDAIHFEAIDHDDEMTNRLVNILDQRGCDVHRRDTAGTWVVDLPSSWEEYLASLTKNHRKRCRRWQRTYFESERAKVICRVPDDCNQGWETIDRLNRQRREQIGDRSAFEDPRFHAFHLAVLPELLRTGNGELRELRMDGTTVAAEYVLLNEETIFCYQSGMATSSSRDGFGNLSILSLFKDAIDRGYQRLDFLRGDEDYKQHWGARRRRCHDIIVAPKTVSGSAYVACHRAMDSMRMFRDAWTATST